MKTLILTMALLTPFALAGKPVPTEHAHQSVGKRGAPVALVSAPRYEVQVGQSVALDLRFALQSAASNVRVEVNADRGLALDKNLLSFELGDRDKGVVSLPTINVAVLDEGRSSVNLVVFMTDRGGETFKSFSVPFATAQAKTVVGQKMSLKTDPAGQPLRVMAAREFN